MKFLFSSLEDALLLRTLLHWRTAAQSTTPRLELSALTKRELTEPLEALGRIGFRRRHVRSFASTGTAARHGTERTYQAVHLVDEGVQTLLMTRRA